MYNGLFLPFLAYSFSSTVPCFLLLPWSSESPKICRLSEAVSLQNAILFHDCFYSFFPTFPPTFLLSYLSQLLTFLKVWAEVPWLVEFWNTKVYFIPFRVDQMWQMLSFFFFFYCLLKYFQVFRDLTGVCFPLTRLQFDCCSRKYILVYNYFILPSSM